MSGIVAIDTETTGIGPDRRIWELGLIVTGELPRWRREDQFLRQGRAAGDRSGRYRWFVHADDLDLGNADPFALRVGRFYERHPQYANTPGTMVREAELLVWVERLTRGAHLLGAVVNFDADVLDRRMRAHGILPSWHYHLIEVEALAVGYLWGKQGWRPTSTDTGEDFRELMTLPWDSQELSRLVGVEPPSEEERHTALGDAAWSLRLYEAITGGGSGA